MADGEERTILVRATLNLPGLRAGSYAFVDPDDPYVREALSSQALVVEEED